MTRLATQDISFIVPKEATNLITNPSFEIDTTGYNADGAGVSIVRVTTYSRRGIASCMVIPASNVTSGVSYIIAVANSIQYSWGIDVLDCAGQQFTMAVFDSTSTIVASLTWMGTGYWKRRNLTFIANASTPFTFYLWRNSAPYGTNFYTDGWQLEVGAPSTYLDGWMRGYVVGQVDYRWNGVPNASTSWRSGQTRSGGTYLKLSNYAKLLTIVGLGLGPVTNIALPSSMGGAFYQNTVSNERLFSLLTYFTGAGDSGVIQRAKAAISAAIKQDATTQKQPVLIQYDALDSTGLEISETLEIQALYEGGLENDGSGNAYLEKVAINFKTFLPLIQQQGEKGAALGYQTSVVNANYALMRTSAGVWQEIAGGTSDITNSVVEGIDGSMYFGGGFALAGGVANTAYVAKWNGSAWSPLGQGGDSSVLALTIGPDGSLYAGGAFTHMHATGGANVANTAYIAKWDGSTWTALGTGMNGVVRALAIGPNGYLYAGGDFTLAGGVANTVRIAVWNGSVWLPLGTGANDTVKALTIGADGSVYVGGDFTDLGSTSGDYVAKWNGAAWSALASGMNNWVYSLAIGPDGLLYAGGLFTSAGGVSALYVAKWNGSIWAALGTGTNNTVKVLSFNIKDNNLYAGGIFSTAGGVNLPDSIAMWNGSSWMPLDVNLPGAGDIYAISFDRSGGLYLGFAQYGTATSATVTVSNAGSAKVYPRVYFTGPGFARQVKNYRTSKAIYFNLTLLAGEVAMLDFDPQNPKFTSTWRGDLKGTILPGSTFDIELLPGANSISTFIYGSTDGNSAITMSWRDQFDGLDGAVR